MAKQTVRIGIVGAGGNTRLRHIPGFREIEGVEIVGVVNRTPESSQRAADEFDIPKTYPDWQSLVADDDIDAVMIGTWPNMHCEITCQALEAGKHVLTEARMALNATEARKMLETSRAQPNLVAQIVPSPFGLVQHQEIVDLIETGYLGDLRELVVIDPNDSFWDASQFRHWRQDKEISGLNVLSMGIMHEAAMRWTSPTTRVLAQTATFEPSRPDPNGDGNIDVTVPDSVQILTQLEGGARGLYHLSGIDLFGPGRAIHLYGSHATIKLELAPQERLLIGRVGDSELQEIEIPAEKRGGWRVEAEFVAAIRGEEQVKFTDFEAGVRYMEFTEAVHQSAETNQAVDLPLSS